MIIEISGKKLDLLHIPGPLGVRGRNSDNQLFEKKIGWRVSEKLVDGLYKTYPWVLNQVETHGKDIGK